MASIPNVANRKVVLGLLNHRFRYEDHGILDRTHLRFFTRESVVELFEDAGFRIQRLDRVLQIGKGAAGQWIRRVVGRESGRERIYPAPLSTVLDAWTFQFLVVAS